MMIKQAVLFMLISAFGGCQSPSLSPEDEVGQRKPFKVDHALVKKQFLAFLPSISNGLELNEHFETNDAKGFKIVVGDLNGDGLMDAVVDYSLAPGPESIGNAIGEYAGLVYFENTGTELIIADHSEEFGGHFGSRNEIQTIKNETLYLEIFNYALEDGRCCPTIQTINKLKIKKGKLIDANDE